MRQDPARPHIVATGGKENALKVWDLQGSEEPLFRAKNVSDGGWRGPGSEFPGVEATDYELETSWVWGLDDLRLGVDLRIGILWMVAGHFFCASLAQRQSSDFLWCDRP